MTTKPKMLETSAATRDLAQAAAKPTFEKTVESLKHSAATAATNMEQAQAKMKEGYTKAMKTAEDVMKFHQGNLEAMMKSSQILATGLTDLGKHVATTAQANMEETMSNLRALTSVKSLKEAFDLQAGFARASMEKAMSESGKLTETSLKLVEQASAPLTARLNAAVDSFSVRT